MKDGMNSANRSVEDLHKFSIKSNLFRYYKNHFKDSVRQCCLDIMHGVELNEIEIQDFWTDLRKVGCIASEILPDEPPSYIPQIALEQEFAFANLLYEMSRSVR